MEDPRKQSGLQSDLIDMSQQWRRDGGRGCLTFNFSALKSFVLKIQSLELEIPHFGRI